jgi:hypothetical protein
MTLREATLVASLLGNLLITIGGLEAISIGKLNPLNNKQYEEI